MSKINIGINIDIQKLIATRMLIQASSGGGKSYLIRVIAEQLAKQKVQQIILDREGEFVSLREKFDFALVSKDGGELPLNIRYAEVLAHKILQTGISVIIDLSEFNPIERIQFAKKFINGLVDSPKNLWHPCAVIIDEAHDFAPEGKESESTSAVVNLCSKGRKRGFAAILATQRLSKLKKDATAECLNKLIGRTGQDVDRKRAGDELGFINKQDTLNLRNLEPGEFFAFGPAISNEVIKFKSSKVETTHSEPGKTISSNPPTPAAIKNILSTLSDIPAEAEKELRTKEDLQKEVNRLTHELKTAQRKPAATAIAPPVNNKALDQLQKSYDFLLLKNQEANNAVQQLKNENAAYKKQNIFFIKQLNDLRTILNKQAPVINITESVQNIPVRVNIIPQGDINIPKTVRNIPAPKNGDGKLGKCSFAILQFLASFPDRDFSKTQAGIASGYSPNSGGFNNSVSELYQLGLITRNNSRLQVNSQADLSSWNFTPQEYSIDTFKSKLGKCEREIYEVLLNDPTKEFTKEELAGATDSQYSPNSGGFNNSISTLNTLELIERSRGVIKLNPELLEL